MNHIIEELRFDVELPEPAEGNAVSQEWMHFKNITRDQLDAVPFRLVQSATMQYGRVNEVMMLGWNMGDGGGPFIPGLPWLGQSFESNFAGPDGNRMMEFHMIYGTHINGKPVQIRTFSDTINTVLDTIDRYMTVNRFYLKYPLSDQPDGSGDRVWAMFQPSMTGAELNLIGLDGRAFKFIFDEQGVNLNLSGDQPKRKLMISGFYEWELPGFRNNGGGELRISNGMKFIPDINLTVDIGSLYYRFKTVYAATLGLPAQPISATYTDTLSIGGRTQLTSHRFKTTDTRPTTVYARALDDKGAGIIEISLMAVNSDGTGAITGIKAIRWCKTVAGKASAGTTRVIMLDEVDVAVSGAAWRLFMNDHKICVEVTGINADMFWYLDIKYSSIQPF